MEPNQETPTPAEPDWVPEACTLPTAERPLRVAEFDKLFVEAVTEVEMAGPTRIRMRLRPEASIAARAAELSVRETACCSFFTFTLIATGGDLALDITVGDGHVGVLRSLTARTRAAWHDRRGGDAQRAGGVGRRRQPADVAVRQQRRGPLPSRGAPSVGTGCIRRRRSRCCE